MHTVQPSAEVYREDGAFFYIFILMFHVFVKKAEYPNKRP